MRSCHAAINPRSAPRIAMPATSNPPARAPQAGSSIVGICHHSSPAAAQILEPHLFKPVRPPSCQALGRPWGVSHVSPPPPEKMKRRGKRRSREGKKRSAAMPQRHCRHAGDPDRLHHRRGSPCTSPPHPRTASTQRRPSPTSAQPVSAPPLALFPCAVVVSRHLAFFLDGTAAVLLSPLWPWLPKFHGHAAPPLACVHTRQKPPPHF
jgi:hypothetical protein